MKAINKILIPTDFSELSLVAVEYVRTHAISTDAKIILFHAIPDMFMFPPYSNVDFNSDTMLSESEEKAKRELHHIASDRFRNNHNILAIVRRGEPWQEIIKIAQDEAVDLIIMGTHGRTGFAHVLMGSVAERVVRHANVPVLILKPKEMQNSSIDFHALAQTPHGGL
ncbi:MAG TPA: universal stress protein [Bacteroidota bacterium]|jgi:nucleotide-binding universal stress UspA family protein|nr:universal stress protein [Bacteroidota bacterium]